MDEAVLIVLLASCAIAVMGTAALTWRTRRFMARAVRARGRISRIVPETQEWPGYGSDHPPETTTSYRPHVEFAREDGARIEFPSRVAHPRSPMHSEGDEVTVVYQRDDPAGTAEIAGPAVWRPVIFATIGTVLLLLFTGLFKAFS